MAPPIQAHEIRIGVCGFCLPQTKLFQDFKLLEVQQTFYWPPQLKTVQRWRQVTPPDFEFTVKAFQAITHPCNSPTYRKTRFTPEERAECGNFRDAPIVREAWYTTQSLATALEANVVVFQCPPSFDASEQNVLHLKRFFNWVTRRSMRMAWEPRHATWTRDIVGQLCRELDLIHVVDPLEQASVYGKPQYLRLHGTAKGGFRYDYNHPYSDEELSQIRKACLSGPTYCLFNNIQMATDAKRFMQDW